MWSAALFFISQFLQCVFNCVLVISQILFFVFFLFPVFLNLVYDFWLDYLRWPPGYSKDPALQICLGPNLCHGLIIYVGTSIGHFSVLYHFRYNSQWLQINQGLYFSIHSNFYDIWNFKVSSQICMGSFPSWNKA